MAKNDIAKAEILELLSNKKGAFSIDDVHKLLPHYKRSHIQGSLSALFRSEKIAKAGHGLYTGLGNASRGETATELFRAQRANGTAQESTTEQDEGLTIARSRLADGTLYELVMVQRRHGPPVELGLGDRIPILSSASEESGEAARKEESEDGPPSED